MIKVLLADDHKIVLDGLSSLIQKEDNMIVAGQALNGRDVLEILQKEKIDVAVLDIEMPEYDGVELTKRIKRDYADTRVLILTMYNEIGFIRRIIAAGAEGYILKNKGKEELILAISEVYKGNDFFSDDINKTLINSMKGSNVSGEVKLTRRELEVLKLIADGKTTPQISKLLFIAHATVETHRRNLIEKTGVENSKGLVRYAVEKGFT